MADRPILVLLGPTAVGKTGIAIQLARHLHGEIVSADSRLFYRGMDIGTAKPSPAEQSGIPHHLVDVTTPDETWSLSSFQQAATQAISTIHACGRLPILVGGTGQYIDAVTYGWTPPAVLPDDRLREVLEKLANEHGKQWLHERLALLDPPAALLIDARNVRRTIRAIEVIFSTGQRFSSLRRKVGSPYALLRIGLTLPRPELYARIDARIDAMFSAGLVDEVGRLLAAGYSPDLPSMSAIGYREAVFVLQGKLTMEEARMAMRKSTRVFVRRQANWFKLNDPGIHWFVARPGCVEAIEQLAREHFPGRWEDIHA